MRLIYAVLALFILMPLAVSAQQGAAVECAAQQSAYTPLSQRYKQGVIFRVEKCGHPTSYVMGTLHLDDPRINPLYEAAASLMQSAVTAVGFEFVENAQSTQMAQQYLFLPPSQPAGLNTLITPEEFQQLTSELQSRAAIPAQAANRMHPWAAAVLLQFPAPSGDGVALDKRLQNAGFELQKSLFSLETPKEQYDVFSAIPLDQQIGMLKDTLKDLAAIDATNERMVEAYVARDMRLIDAIAAESMAMIDDIELQTYMQDALIVARNKRMVRRMQPKLIASPSLVAVGALHLMGGDTGVLPLLEAEGWRIYPHY